MTIYFPRLSSSFITTVVCFGCVYRLLIDTILTQIPLHIVIEVGHYICVNKYRKCSLKQVLLPNEQDCPWKIENCLQLPELLHLAIMFHHVNVLVVLFLSALPIGSALTSLFLMTLRDKLYPRAMVLACLDQSEDEKLNLQRSIASQYSYVQSAQVNTSQSNYFNNSYLRSCHCFTELDRCRQEFQRYYCAAHLQFEFNIHQTKCSFQLRPSEDLRIPQ